MDYPYDQFGVQLVAEISGFQGNPRVDPNHPQKVLAPYPGGDWAGLDLTPFSFDVQSADAGGCFNSVTTVGGLIDAYRQTRRAKRFEEDLPNACNRISEYAFEFLEHIFSRATQILEDDNPHRASPSLFSSRTGRARYPYFGNRSGMMNCLTRYEF